MWDLPRPGIEPVSPALAGGFLTTGQPGKSSLLLKTPCSNRQVREQTPKGDIQDLLRSDFCSLGLHYVLPALCHKLWHFRSFSLQFTYTQLLKTFSSWLMLHLPGMPAYVPYSQIQVFGASQGTFFSIVPSLPIPSTR